MEHSQSVFDYCIINKDLLSMYASVERIISPIIY